MARHGGWRRTGRRGVRGYAGRQQVRPHPGPGGLRRDAARCRRGTRSILVTMPEEGGEASGNSRAMSYYALTFSNLRPFDLGQVSILRVSGEDGQAPRRAIEALRQGRGVVYPTGTVYGLGCRIDDEGAEHSIFAINPTPPTEPAPPLRTGSE